MKTTRNIPGISLALLCGFAASTSAATVQTWTSIDVPGSENTQAWGVSDGIVVGDYYNQNSPVYGYIYNNGVYTTVTDPNAGSATVLTGVSGSEYVGYYTSGDDNGFIHNGSSFTTLNDPLGAGGTQIFGISGKSIVGTYIDSQGASHGFLYNGSTSTFTTIDDPLASETANLGTFIHGISSSGEIVGTYFTGNGGYSAFTDVNGTFTTLSEPNAVQSQGGTFIFGIAGSELVGGYFDANDRSHGFTYNGSTWTTLDYPGTFGGTYATGVDVQGEVVGDYEIPSGFQNAFILEPVPEPSTLALAGLGAVALCLRRWQRHGQ
jgi:PEP-CTERM motif